MLRGLILVLCILCGPALAVTPSEMLDDPVLESRAREISKGLRCPVCRNENIDDSHAAVSSDLRVLVRERLLAGDSDAQVVSYIVERYGEYVLLRPQTGGANLILWIAGPFAFVVALGIGLVFIRSRRRAGEGASSAGLSLEEQKRLKEIMGE